VRHILPNGGLASTGCPTSRASSKAAWCTTSA
jgi:hypothetical protein